MYQDLGNWREIGRIVAVLQLDFQLSGGIVVFEDGRGA
jgi:hypothetical protein